MAAIKSRWPAALVLTVLAATTVAAARPAPAPTKIFEIGSIAAVYNGASVPSIFTTTQAWTVTEIWDYHWNDAKGATSTGTIGLKSLSTGKMYGPYRTVGSDGQGGVPNAYWHTTTKFTIPAGRYKVIDSSPGTWSQNDESGHRGMTWVMALPSTDAWPALPDALVSLASVSNGCGGGVAGTAARWGDTSTYLNSNNPFGTKYEVNFREACNMHDAGYSGAKVHDPLHGGKIVDTWSMNQKDVDWQFLQDMRGLCEAQIPATATVALADCKYRGGKTSIGAFTRYAAVVTVGSHFWRDRPKLAGTWSQGEGTDAALLSLAQSDRHVTGTFHSGTGEAALTGEFRGTVISRDQDSIVKGFAKVTKAGNTAIRPLSFTVNPDTPNVIEASGLGLSGALNRA